MQDSYELDDSREQDTPAKKKEGDIEPPGQPIPDELPPVRIGEVEDDTKKLPERQKDLRERLPETGLDPDDTIGDLPLVRRNPDTGIDEPPSGDDKGEKPFDSLL